MRRIITLGEAAEAAEEIASILLGFNVRKAIDPLTPAGFLLICDAVSKRLAKAAAGAEAEVVSAAIDELDLDWKNLSSSATDAALKAIRKAIAESYTTKVIPKIVSAMNVEGPKVMRATRASMKATTNSRVEIATKLTDRDYVAEKYIRHSHVNYIRRSTGKRIVKLSQKARSIVARGVSQGVDTSVIAADLKKTLTDDIPRPDSYWKVVADAFVGRARAASQVYALDDASIATFEVVAVMDDVTTDICRFMHGKIFSVSVAVDLLKSLESLADPEDVRFAHPWVRRGLDDDGVIRLYVPKADGSTVTITKVQRSGVGSIDDRGEYMDSKSDSELADLGIPIPPYHGRCRSTIVAGPQTTET